MPISPHIRRQIRSILAIVSASVAVGTLYEPLTTGQLTFWGPLTGLLLGVPLVLFEVLHPLRFTRNWSFSATVLMKSFLYLTLILAVFLGSTLVYGFIHDLTLTDFAEAVWSGDTVMKVGVSACAFVTIIFFRQLNRLLGPGTLMRYIFGRYHRPHREARIFMFLDLKDSTSIAEQLDVDSYYALLNDFFHDIAEPVLATEAQIYQYIGDEVVLTWPMATGLRDANCVRVFAEIDIVVQKRASYYLGRYGLIPEYKAGIYGGEVISAEIGDLKRDLIYNGDVLNTAARIRSECGRFRARLLASSALIGQLVLPSDMIAEDLGDVTLKGKRQPIRLVRISHRKDIVHSEPSVKAIQR